jgi:hypothetical protein
MVLVRLRRENLYYLRPRCKSCHNGRERGHRREWKRKYLQRWRAKNAKLNESYWKGSDRVRERGRVNAARRFKENHDALLIQGRLRRRGMPVSINEAKELLRKYGPCYPSRFGLTRAGLKECERIRSVQRRRNPRCRLSPVEIRIMVYEDGLHIKPSRQRRPYKESAKKLRKWQRARRVGLGKK